MGLLWWPHCSFLLPTLISAQPWGSPGWAQTQADVSAPLAQHLHARVAKTQLSPSRVQHARTPVNAPRRQERARAVRRDVRALLRSPAQRTPSSVVGPSMICLGRLPLPHEPHPSHLLSAATTWVTFLRPTLVSGSALSDPSSDHRQVACLFSPAK